MDDFSCGMGQGGANPGGRVFGVTGLRVADASVFPTIPSAGTHISVLMTAEKMSDHIKADWRR
jgi:choline dehydrogenase-like flavoprotein